MSMTGAVFVLAPVASLSRAETDAQQVAAGAMVYADYCANCHGEQLRNTTGGATFDLRRLRPADRDRFVSVVLNGKSQMPPWRGVLAVNQIESIWAYIRATLDR
jgi:mono/diheme cytochrome c family protein